MKHGFLPFLVSFLAVAAVGSLAVKHAQAGSGEAYEIAFFTQQGSAGASSTGGDDSDNVSSTDITNLAPAAIAFAEGGDELCDCFSAASSITGLQVEGATPGPAMTTTITTSTGCIPDTVCPITGSANTGSQPFATGRMSTNDSASWNIRLNLLQQADLSVRFVYDLSVDVGGTFTTGNASATYSASVTDGSLNTLFTKGVEVGLVSTGIDSMMGSETFTLPNAPAGTYFIGVSQGSTTGLKLSDPDLSGTTNVSINTRTEITATVCDEVTTTTSTLLPTTSTTLAPMMACGDPIVDVAQASGSQSSHPRTILASDALFILRVAVGSAACELCICDVNGDGAVRASDALAALKIAVGQEVPLLCPPCAG